MSAQLSPSPQHGLIKPIDESKLPQGQCRYILLQPEIKGARCACVNFTLNRSMPSVTCDCGHLACYHLRALEPPIDNTELERLRRRIKVLEDQLDREQHGGIGRLVHRVSEMEERLESSKDEVETAFRTSYRNVDRAWQSIAQLERRHAQDDERFRDLYDRFAGVDEELRRMDDKQRELAENDIDLEDRIDVLEEEIVGDSPASRPRLKSTSDSTPPPLTDIRTAPDRHLSAGAGEQAQWPMSRPMPFRTTLAQPPNGSWTVHISLLPTASQPFPFEKDTNAYKRCLSRGLHQMVAVNGIDAESFTTAVTKAFASLLRGRMWMPIQAQLCDAPHLRGLPMLRQLDSRLVDSNYDVNFIRRHCAVCDASGKIDSLYIALREGSFSWRFLKHAPVYLGGLESCWAYDSALDHFLDPNDESAIDDSSGPSAGDILPQFHPENMKRSASEISRANSFGSATAGPEGCEGSRAKAPRTSCPLLNVAEVRRRRVETA